MAQAGGPCGSPAPGAHAASHCRRCFNHRHVVCLRRRGPCAAPRAAGRRCATEPLRPGAPARPGGSGLVHLVLRVLHVVAAGRETGQRARRPRGPRPCRSVPAATALPRGPRASGPTRRVLGHRWGSCCCCGLAPADPVTCTPPRDADKGTVCRRVPRPALGAGLARAAGVGGRPLRCGCACSRWVPLAHSLDTAPTFGSGSCPCACPAQVAETAAIGLLPLQTRLNSPSP